MNLEKRAQKYANQMARYLFDCFEKKHTRLPEITLVKPIRVFDKREKKFRLRTPEIDGSGYYVDNQIVLIIPKKGIILDKEYKNYHKNKIIGDFKGNQTARLKMVIAHEIAHWAQDIIFKDKGIFKPAHGLGFKMLYMILRTKFVNKNECPKAKLRKKKTIS